MIMEILAVTILALLFAFVCYIGRNCKIMDLFSRSTETRIRRSAVNPNKIKPDVVCPNKHALTRALTRRVINNGFSTPSEEDLNHQSCLRLKAKVDDKNQILLENERLANELSLLQSKLTDSSSKLQMFQNVHDELATTKNELENNKRVMADMKEKNLRLTNEDSRLRRKIEDRDRLIASSRAELEDVQITNDQKLDKVHDLLAVTKTELQSKNEEVDELQSKNLRLERNDKRLRQKLEDRDRLIASSRAELEHLQICFNEQELDKVHDDLAVVKSELESKNRAISELETKNLHLAENDKRLRRKMEHINLLLLSSRAELKNLRTSLDDQKLDKVHDKLDVAKRELQSKNREMNVLQNKNFRLALELEAQKRTISDLETKNLCLVENDGQLRRKIEDTDLLLQSTRAETERLREELQDVLYNDSQLRRTTEDTGRILVSSQLALEELQLSINNQNERVEQLLDQMRTLAQEKDEALRKMAEMEQQKMKPKSTVEVGCGCDDHQFEEPIPPAVTEITEIVTEFLSSGLSAQVAQPVNLPESSPSVFHHQQIEEPIRPALEITEIVTAFLSSGSTTALAKSPITVPQEHQPLTTDGLKIPARTVVENKAVKVSTKQPPAVLPEYSISSSVEKQVYENRIVVTGITNKDYGRVVGRNGSNVKRIEEQYGARLSFTNGDLLITGGNEKSRLAACKDVIENLPVTMECPKLDLRRTTFSNDCSLRDFAYKHTVHIYRPCREYKYVTIWGKVENCRKVYEILQKGSR